MKSIVILSTILFSALMLSAQSSTSSTDNDNKRSKGLKSLSFSDSDKDRGRTVEFRDLSQSEQDLVTHALAQLGPLGRLSNLSELEGLSGLSKLDGLSQLSGLHDLAGLSKLEKLSELSELEGLVVLADLKNLDMDDITVGEESGSYHIYYDGDDINHNNRHSRSASKKEHKIAMSSGSISIEGLEQVKIVGYSGSEVIMTRSSDDEEHDSRAKGLRIINSLGVEDNTGLGIHASKDANRLTIIQVSKSCCDDDLEIKVPHGISIEVSNSAVGSGNIDISDVKDEIVISTSYSDINLENVTGPLAVKSVYGGIEATMSSISQEGSINLYSVYDIIDITIPASAKADIELSTPYGEIYTDLDIKVEEKSSMRRLSSKEISGTTNGGGVTVSLKSGYDNIYLRKNKDL